VGFDPNSKHTRFEMILQFDFQLFFWVKLNPQFS